MASKKVPNPEVKKGKETVICLDTILEGKIEIGSSCVIHPRVEIIAQDGPIIIGNGNLFEEKCVIINKNPHGVTEQTPLFIGDNNSFEVQSVFEGKFIGDNNILETKAKVGTCTKITNGCVIGAKCEINTAETLPENTIICGSNNLRRVNSTAPTYGICIYNTSGCHWSKFSKAPYSGDRIFEEDPFELPPFI